MKAMTISLNVADHAGHSLRMRETKETLRRAEVSPDGDLTLMPPHMEVCRRQILVCEDCEVTVTIPNDYMDNV